MLVGITESMERPFIKWVENQSELEQAFSDEQIIDYFRKHHGDLLESCIPKADRELRM